MKIDNKKFSEILKQQKIKRLFLCQELNISSRTIAKIAKNEEINQKIIEKIANYLKIDMQNIIKHNEVLETLRKEKISKVHGGLYHETQIRMAYNSNHIEGSVLTEKQTRYIFETEYLKSITSLLSDSVTKLGNDYDFFEVKNPEKLYEVRQIMKQRILDFHIANGVNILDKATTQIDADVVISYGTTISQNNVITGLTYIGKNCKIEPNNIIHDSVISDNCIVKCSYIDESRISENMIVGPFESIVGKSN